ncbi:hypothetical protein Bbelb_132290 [Branchiostoma belcheri]|nr:hypothetical protein Bbelb_132290 [Branchiostoma belcheri]
MSGKTSGDKSSRRDDFLHVLEIVPDRVQLYRGNVSCCTTHPRQGTSISGNVSCCTTHPRQGTSILGNVSCCTTHPRQGTSISGECVVLYDTSPTGYIGGMRRVVPHIPDRVQVYRGNASCCTTHPRQGTSISGECVVLYHTSPTGYKYIGGMCRVVRHIPDRVCWEE